jgi:hypothetical protein
VALVPVLLATPATEAAPDGTSYRLSGDRLDVVVRRRADGWAIADGSAPVTCSIGGADDALLLFILGRLAPTDDRLTVSDAAQAAMFKRYFPGP